MLRISLAILIYMFHSWMHFGCNYSILTDFVSVGAIAMTGFFLLSGYTLRLVYGEQNLMEKHSLGRFYLKRMLGILPLYYFVALLYIVLIGRESISENLMLMPIEALGLQSTFSSLFSVTHNGGTWFVSCLILAYVIYPFLQTVFKQITIRYKMMLLLIFVFLDIWASVISSRFSTAWTYDNPFYRILEFTCGLMVADINISYNNKILKFLRNGWTLICGIIVLIAGVSLMHHFYNYEDYMKYNIIAIPCFIVMLFSLESISLPKIEKTNVIGYLGAISYGFFLSQYFAWKAGKWSLYFIGYDTNWLRIIIPFIFCLCASIFMYEVIQKPVVKMVNRKQ